VLQIEVQVNHKLDWHEGIYVYLVSFAMRKEIEEEISLAANFIMHSKVID